MSDPPTPSPLLGKISQKYRFFWGSFHSKAKQSWMSNLSRTTSWDKNTASYLCWWQVSSQAHVFPSHHSQYSLELECAYTKNLVIQSWDQCLLKRVVSTYAKTWSDPLKKPAMILSLSSLSSSPPIFAIADLLGILYRVPSSAHCRRSHPAGK